MIYLIVINYYSQFIEVEPLKEDTKSQTIIKRLTKMFPVHGILDKPVTDNVLQVITRKFKQFATKFHFTNVTSSPQHRKGNSRVGCANQTVRHLIKNSQENNNSFYLVLLNLTNPPRHTDTGSPAQRLFVEGQKVSCQLPTHYSKREPWTRKMCATDSTSIVTPLNITGAVKISWQELQLFTNGCW